MCMWFFFVGSSTLLDDHAGDSALSVQQSINKSHSDSEIVTSSSQDQNDLSYPPSTNVTGYNYSHPMSDYSSNASPQVFISEAGSVAMSMANSNTPQESPVHRGYGSQTMPPVGSAAYVDQRKSGEIRKSFNTAFTNLSKFTEKVKQNVKKDLLDLQDDSGVSEDWDSASIKSGASSDDEDFVVLKLASEMEIPAFERRRHSASETASVSAGSEGRDPDSTSILTISSGAERARGVVCTGYLRQLGIWEIVGD